MNVLDEDTAVMEEALWETFFWIDYVNANWRMTK